MNIDIDHLKLWEGLSESHEQVAVAAPAQALAAVLDRDDREPGAGSELPPGWHWLYFLPMHRQSEIGVDGHPRRGGFLPPVPLPRRMWAGSRIDFLQPLRIGGRMTKTSRIESVSLKDGRSGPLVFVRVRHELAGPKGMAVIEDQDIVYRDHPAPGEPIPEPRIASEAPDWVREIHPDEVLLFRFSALTFNGHRIHYDRRYAVEVEGYPGLVVHGPLTATLLLDLLRCEKPNSRVTHFSFRAVKPLFDTAPFQLCGRCNAADQSVSLWARDAFGHVAMEAIAKLA